jgi:hypothetical protein
MDGKLKSATEALEESSKTFESAVKSATCSAKRSCVAACSGPPGNTALRKHSEYYNEFGNRTNFFSLPSSSIRSFLYFVVVFSSICCSAPYIRTIVISGLTP